METHSFSSYYAVTYCACNSETVVRGCTINFYDADCFSTWCGLVFTRPSFPSGLSFMSSSFSGNLLPANLLQKQLQIHRDRCSWPYAASRAPEYKSKGLPPSIDTAL